MDVQEVNLEAFSRWAEAQDTDTCVALATRIALAVLPLATTPPSNDPRDRLDAKLDFTLQSLRLVQMALLATQDDDIELRRIAFLSRFDVGGEHPRLQAASSACAAWQAVAAGADVVYPGPDPFQGFFDPHAPSALVRALESAIAACKNEVRLQLVSASELLRIANLQSEVIGLPSRDLAFLPFVDPKRLPLRDKPDGGANPWSFWSRWYDRAMAGDPLPRDLQREVALIPDRIWKQGPEAVAERIVEIEARYDVKQAIQALERDTDFRSMTSRLGIGGNAPPEPIEMPADPTQSVTIIWAAVDEIAEEVEKNSPDKARIEAALRLLRKGLGVCAAWVGRKLDLALNVSITTGVGTTIAAAMAGPDKVQALIQAVEKWLPHLP